MFYNEMKRHKIFPTTVWEYQIADPNFLDEYAKKFIDIRENEGGGLYSGLGNWVSPDDLHEREDWKPIKDILIDRMHVALQDQGIMYDDIVINCMWGNSHEGKSQHQVHHHPNCMFSGVMYLATPGIDKGNLFFTDPRGVAPYSFVYEYEKGFNNHELIQFVPEKGKIIIFPSWLQHGTNPGEFGGEERISLSFNVMLKTKINKRSIKLEI